MNQSMILTTMLNSEDTFIFQGQILPYNRNPHNNIPPSERAIEIPIALQFLSSLVGEKKLLEVGNVLSYYQDLLPDNNLIKTRRIIDKYEVIDGVENIDLMELSSTEKYEVIVSISTVEHIGQSTEPNQTYGEEIQRRDMEAPLKAIAKIYELLTENGKALITVPFGRLIDYKWLLQFSQEYLEILTKKYQIPPDAMQTTYFKVVEVDADSTPPRSLWVEAKHEDVKNCLYNVPFLFANAIAVIELKKVSLPLTQLDGEKYPLSTQQKTLNENLEQGKNKTFITNKLCVYRDFETDYYQSWITKLKQPKKIHRKYWEWVVMCQALSERGYLNPGKKGLGFAVGNEPLPATFASFGCEIVATDQGDDSPEAKDHWGKSDQLCRGKTALNELGICPPDIFEKQVNFCPVDMNNIPPDLKQGKFDFVWSSCAFEHIGSIEHGFRFVKEAMKCVKPGGLAIHTTEFNCSSNQGTINSHNLVFFRLRDIQRLIKELELEGYRVHPIDYYLGDNDYDLKPMREPHNPPAPHLKIELGGYVATSLLLMIENPINNEVKPSLAVSDSSKNNSGLIKILYDLSVLGFGHYDPRSRTGVARVIENIALGLVSSPEFDLSFCGTRSLFAANACLDYLETQPKFQGIAFHHSSFLKILYHQLREIYQLTEIPERLANNITLNSSEQPLIQHIKKSLSYSLNLFTEAPSLLDDEVLQQSDIFHATFFSVPPQIRNFKKIKVFATIYDLIPIILSHLFKEKNDADYQRMLLSLQSLRPDDYILCISHATRDDLLNHVKLDPARVFVTHLAANPQMFYPCYDQAQMTNVRKKYGIPNAPYILGVSTLEPRKNLDLVIRSFAHVVQQEKLQDINLVLVGPKGWEYNKIFEEVANFGIAKERIIITGYVADEDLAPLYSGALVFIYPSLYEGFGLPPLEAMQCGVPVITSNNSSLPEVVGDAGIMLDPKDETGVCQNILKLYYSQSLRQEMSAKSLQQARKFTWERCTQETIAAYKIALSS